MLLTPEQLAALWKAATSCGVGMLGGASRVGVFGWRRPLEAASGVVASGFVGAVVGLSADAVSINGHEASLTVTWGAILIAGFVGRDLLAGLRSLGEQFKANPAELAGRVIAGLKGY